LHAAVRIALKRWAPLAQSMLALAPRLPLAEAIPVALMGDSIATNAFIAFMLGLAFQKGTIPLSLEAILCSRS
jgi:hypothetical protein